MAMLAGLKGVGSAEASQLATQIRAPLATHVKTGLHLPSFLQAVVIDTLTAYVDNHEGLLAKVYDAGLKLYPLELKNRCTSATCHRLPSCMLHSTNMPTSTRRRTMPCTKCLAWPT
jgi:cholesterol oxidase